METEALREIMMRSIIKSWLPATSHSTWRRNKPLNNIMLSLNMNCRHLTRKKQQVMQARCQMPYWCMTEPGWNTSGWEGKGLVHGRRGRHKCQPNRQCCMYSTESVCSGESCVKNANAVAEKLSKQEQSLKAECRDGYQVRTGKIMSSWLLYVAFLSNS